MLVYVLITGNIDSETGPFVQSQIFVKWLKVCHAPAAMFDIPVVSGILKNDPTLDKQTVEDSP